MSNRLLTAASLVALSGLAFPCSGAEDAADMLRDAHKRLHECKDFSTTMTQTMSFVMFGDEQKQESAFELAAVRPNKFVMKSSGEMGMGDIMCDGKTIWFYVPMAKKYTENAAPESFDELFLPEAAMEYGIMDNGALGFLSPILSNDTWADIEKGLEGGAITIESVGTSKDGDDELTQLRMSFNASQMAMFEDLVAMAGNDIEMTMDFWVNPATDVVAKISPDLKPILAAMADSDAGGGMMPDEINMVVAFKNWKLDSGLGDEIFAFNAPEDAELTDDIFGDMMAGEMEMDMADDGVSMVGSEAPSFTCDLLDGETLDIVSHRGNDIVVLDFWATWCGPCVKGLPGISGVTAELKDKGVVFYAVNQRESNDKVQDFLTKKGLDFNVAMDRDGSIGKLFGVSGIPQTVIIDSDGIVQAIHVGYSPGDEKKLKKELETLINGGSLIEEDDDF